MQKIKSMYAEIKLPRSPWGPINPSRPLSPRSPMGPFKQGRIKFMTQLQYIMVKRALGYPFY